MLCNFLSKNSSLIFEAESSDYKIFELFFNELIINSQFIQKREDYDLFKPYLSGISEIDISSNSTETTYLIEFLLSLNNIKKIKLFNDTNFIHSHNISKAILSSNKIDNFTPPEITKFNDIAKFSNDILIGSSTFYNLIECRKINFKPRHFTYIIYICEMHNNIIRSKMGDYLVMSGIFDLDNEDNIKEIFETAICIYEIIIQYMNINPDNYDGFMIDGLDYKNFIEILSSLDIRIELLSHNYTSTLRSDYSYIKEKYNI